jgi:hypothetical protein
MCPMRPLDMEDLVHTVSIGSNGVAFKEVNEELTVKICSSFIIKGASGQASFAHLSVREYLGDRETDGIREYDPGCSNAQAAETCLAYLSYSKTGHFNFQVESENFPQYAVGFWFSHWKLATGNREGQLGRLYTEFLPKKCRRD